jgi:hypothetical protein
MEEERKKEKGEKKKEKGERRNTVYFLYAQL